MHEELRRAKNGLELVRAALNRLDPYDLDPGTDSPADEYEPEVAPMASALLNSGRISLDEVDSIWSRWFHEPLSDVVGPAAADAFVVELNALPLTA